MLATSKSGDRLIIQVMERRFDAALAPGFREQVHALVDPHQGPVILDLSRVEFMDSSGLGALVSVLKMVGGPDSFAISGANGAVMKLIKLTRLDRVLRLYDGIDAAVAGVAG